MTRIHWASIAAAFLALSGQASAQVSVDAVPAAFGAVKDAYMVAVADVGGQTPEGHARWCANAPPEDCLGELRFILSGLAGAAGRPFVTQEGRCHIGANLKAAREQITASISGGRSGHFVWCMANGGRAEAFANEEIAAMQSLFGWPGG